jgi:two-component system, NarL family, sensor histidine kinase DesK
MRLLPRNEDWTAYWYLIYLVYFVVVPFLFPASAAVRWATLAGAAVALPLYFIGYWLRGPKVLWVVAAFFALGTVFAKFNTGASVFFVYSACYLADGFEPKVAYRWLAGVVAAVGLVALLFRYTPWVWIPAIVFSAFVGSVVIQQAQKRRLTSRLVAAQGEAEHLAKVAERERIARDLHDLLGHTLSVIILKSELASRLTPTDPARAADEIRDVERISREALAQVRDAVRGYRSAGIEGELKAARGALEAAGIRVETALHPGALPSGHEAVFALALREAVTNVVRHSRATACRISLARQGDFCELEIADDGRGGALDEGSGLRGMRERVEQLGGALECDGSRGTLLRIRAPV